MSTKSRLFILGKTVLVWIGFCFILTFCTNLTESLSIKSSDYFGPYKGGYLCHTFKGSIYKCSLNEITYRSLQGGTVLITSPIVLLPGILEGFLPGKHDEIPFSLLPWFVIAIIFTPFYLLEKRKLKHASMTTKEADQATVEQTIREDIKT